ncbi:putative receptor-like protein kinase [Quercus suber]|uniref:Receptor-like protein kinase n=1 Tax=Quercus suber TaxID=58331 RepID=A0AAW0L4N5_QUESU
MEDKKANIVAVTTVISLTILIIVARVLLKLSKAFFLICGAGIAVILAVFAYLVIRRHYNRRRQLLESKLVSEGRELRIEYSFLRKVAGVPTKFRYKELEEATDNFHSLLGQGASATVFKGILNDGTAVAVKRISGEERGEKEFRSEVAAIASVQHVNLLHLLGYCCVPGEPRFLVYEFMPNEMIGGRRNICLVENGKDKSERKWIYFPKIVNEKLGEGKLMEVVDPRLVHGGGIDEGEVRRLVYVALWCIQERARMRPSMARVVEMLEGRVAVDAPPDSKMIVVDLLSMDHEEQPDGHNRPKVAAIAPILVDSSCPTTSTCSFAMSVLSPR